jgi:PAS domain S-box-containing protein
LAADDEERMLQIAALRNAEEILLARQRAEHELRDAKADLERKNEELLQQRELFAITLSSIGDAVITTDIQGKITFLNPIAETMTGWTLEEASGQALDVVFTIINETTRQPVEHPVSRVLRDGRSVELANHSALVGRHGITTAIEDSAAPIRDLKGNLIGAVMVFHDVTARRHAEAALSESELQYRTVFNQAAVGIAVTNLNGLFLQVNRKLSELLGFTLEELQQRTFLQITHPQDSMETADILRQLSTGELSDAVLEKRCVRKDGAVIWTLSTVALVRDSSGLPHHLTGIMEDITQRKQAEEAQARLAAVITSSDDSIISMTLDGVVTSWNFGAERMYGYTADEMIGQTTRTLLPPGRPDEEPAILERIRRGERIDHFETVRIRKDRIQMDVSIAVSPIEDTRGRIIGASKITRDITQSKRTEAVLREMDRRKDEFLATLAHELRNPLAPIRQAALISKADRSTDAQKRWSHDVITRQVQHMSLLLDDLLDISRITRGTLELRLESSELGRVIEAAVETARPIIDAKRHRFSVSAPQDSIRLIADPLRLAQVLSNLLTNAAKYTDPEGQIQLRVERQEESVVISVKDSGIGIAAEAKANLFEMFSQVKSTQDRSEGGLGIGLALAKGLIDLHGGKIEARSAGLGFGSEFVVRLPWHAPHIKASADLSAANAERPSPRRILIADDNRDAAESLAMLLEIDGHQVRIAHDGRAAVAAFAEFQPEMALVDIGMPEMNGYEVAHRLRQSSSGRAATLIAVTGWGQERDKARALEAGFNHHFTKPLEPERITEILRSMDEVQLKSRL